MQSVDETRAAREALDRHAWREAFERFQAADQVGELQAEDLELFGEAAWWAGEPDAMIGARERAYAAYQAAGNTARSGRVALTLALDYMHRLEQSLSTGWLNRARRLLEDHPDSLERAYLLRVEAVRAHEGEGDNEKALPLIREALDIATRHGDRDLQAMTLLDQGRFLVAMGKLDEGQALMDEAMVAAVGGDVGPYATGVIYCNMIGSCQRIADYKRAGEWTQAASRWCQRQSINGFPGVCRVHRAEIMRLRGAWTEAEAEARQACDELATHNMLDLAGEGFYEIGEIRLRMGDLAAAEEAFRQAHEMGREPNPGLASLRLAQGKADAAARIMRRALSETIDPLMRARLLPAHVDVSLAVDDVGGAREAAEELGRTAEAYGTPALHALASTAKGTALLAEGDAEGAMERLRHALKHWRESDAPYEAARTRVLMGRAARALGDEDTAAMELQAARSALDKLGAVLDARAADELLGGDGGPVRRVSRTFMFTDIVRSTNLVEAIGDEAWEGVVRWHDQALRASFGRHGGEEVDHAGDGFFVAFADAAAAVECAVEIQRALADHRRSAGFAPQVRIGLHAAEATERTGDYGGKGVHAAARVGALAEGGEILATEETAAGAGPRYAASEPREVRLKGISEPVRVVSVAWQ
jgi:class 3 adenylate cyclase